MTGPSPLERDVELHLSGLHLLACHTAVGLALKHAGVPAALRRHLELLVAQIGDVLLLEGVIAQADTIAGKRYPWPPPVRGN